MSQNSRWGTLPNEIINLITSYCGRNCLEVKWMFVNKHWFDFYLSITYNSISIDLASDNKLDKILYSQLNIGKWVKRISFTKLQPPSDIYQLNKLDDPLFLLMKHTPDVEEVEFSPNHTFDFSDWTYFSIILMGTKSWKLQVLPEINESKLFCSAHYFGCAYYMRHSLKKVNLTLGMIDISNYGPLSVFPALEVLNIGKGIVNDFKDLDFVLQSLPNLKGIGAKFSEDPADSPQSELKNCYPNIKDITLENFIPNLDMEIAAFTKYFPNLNRVQIIERKNILWPSNEIGCNSVQALFGFLNFISEYQITVTGDDNAANLITQWSKWAKAIRKDSLTVEFSSKPYTDIPGNVSLTIKNSKFNSEGIFNHYNQNYSAGLNSSESIKNTVSFVKLQNLRTNESSITALLQKNCPNLETLILDEVSFMSISNDIKPPNTCLKSLEFHNCSFQVISFQKFTNQFQSLDFLVFDQCLFSLNDGNKDKTTIDLVNCKIGTMYISNLESEVYLSNPRKVETMEFKFFIICVLCV